MEAGASFVTTTTGLGSSVTSSPFGVNAAVTLANVSAAGLNLNGFDTTIGSLSGGGTLGGNIILGGNTLTVGSNMGVTTVFGGSLTGTGGSLIKNGYGTLDLTSNSSNYTGTTTINGGAIVITTPNALGTSTVVINGNETRGGNNSSVIPAYGGGQLVIGGGITFSDNIFVSGGGPSGDGSALVTVGNVTLSGNVSFENNFSGSRFASSQFGLATLTGTVTIANNAATQFGGNGNFDLSGATLNVIGGATAGLSGNGNTILQKIGGGTLILGSANNNNFSGQLDVNAGTVRIRSAAALGTNLNGVRLSGGTLEVRADAATSNFTTSVNGGAVNTTGNNGIFVDRALGGTYLGGSWIGNTGVGSITAPNSIIFGQAFATTEQHDDRDRPGWHRGAIFTTGSGPTSANLHHQWVRRPPTARAGGVSGERSRSVPTAWCSLGRSRPRETSSIRATPPASR